jgi:hypothetical protein
MKKIKAFIAVGLAGMLLMVNLLMPSMVFADAKTEICKGIGAAGGGSTDCSAGTTTVEGVIGTVINVLSWVIGIIAVIMVIVGGLKYITSSGDSNNVNSAKNTILYAIVGLVVVALAQVIVRFVLKKI